MSQDYRLVSQSCFPLAPSLHPHLTLLKRILHSSERHWVHSAIELAEWETNKIPLPRGYEEMSTPQDVRSSFLTQMPCGSKLLWRSKCWGPNIVISSWAHFLIFPNELHPFCWVIISTEKYICFSDERLTDGPLNLSYSPFLKIGRYKIMSYTVEFWRTLISYWLWIELPMTSVLTSRSPCLGEEAKGFKGSFQDYAPRIRGGLMDISQGQWMERKHWFLMWKLYPGFKRQWM